MGLMRSRATRIGCCLLFACLSTHTMALDLDALWNFADPAASEQRLRAALDGASPDDRLILQTQIARSHGLRLDFDAARRVLAEVEPRLDSASAEARVRYLLELGRSHASAAHPPEALTAEARDRARALYQEAFERAERACLDGLAVDALHMMVVVDPEPDQQLAWNRKAVAYMARSDQPAAKRWEGALRNNIGYALHLKGDHEAALAEFALSREAYRRAGRERNVRYADWMIAWTWRVQGRLDEALAEQLRLEREWAAAGESDPSVFEELETIYRAHGDDAKAAHYRLLQAAGK